MRVEISIDCGGSYATIYEKEGLDLSTVPNFITTDWAPTSVNDWRTEEIDLGAYEGSTAIFRIINISGFGNGTFVDNFNLEATLSVDENELTGISIFPNPARNQVNVVLPNTIVGSTKFEITNNLGQVISRSESTVVGGSVTLDITSLSRGLYFVAIENATNRTVKKLIVR